MQSISIIDFETEAFTRAVRGQLTNCDGRPGSGRAAPCEHGRQGEALRSILGVPIRRARDLYAGRARYTRDEAAAVLRHLGLSEEEFARYCRGNAAISANRSTPTQPNSLRSQLMGHSIALTIWNHADDTEFVRQSVRELLDSAENDPEVDMFTTAQQALEDLRFGLGMRFPGYRDPIPSAAIVGVDRL